MHDKHGQIVVAYKNIVKAMADFSMERTLGTGKVCRGILAYYIHTSIHLLPLDH